MRKLVALLILACFGLFSIGRILKLDLNSIIFFLWIPTISIGLSFFYWFRKIYFYRDPQRKVPQEANIIVSPADGRVIYIYPVKNGQIRCNKKGSSINIHEISKTDIAKDNGWLIGIYMSPLDVHFNYAPIEGKVSRIYYHKARLNLPMVDLWEYINFTLLRRAINLFSRKFHFFNERLTMEITNRNISCLVILIADKFVNKITKFFSQNQAIEIGQKITFIERGSQADLFIPRENIDIRIAVGQKVYGASTIIATYPNVD